MLAALREVRSYLGTIASDGMVTFANIPPGRYVLDVQLFDERDEQHSEGVVGVPPIAERVRATVSVPESANTSDVAPVSVGNFTLEPQ